MTTPRVRTISAVTALAVLGISSISFANGLGENVAWQFRTPNERAVQIQELELRLLEQGGFFDSFGHSNGSNGGGGGGNTTIIEGDQYNCSVSSVTVGNDAANALDGITGTLMGVTGSSIGSTAAGNTSAGNVDVDGSGSGANNTDQNNDGAVDASVNDSGNYSSVGNFHGGGVTDQVLNSEQVVDNSTLTSSAEGTVSCDRIYN